MKTPNEIVIDIEFQNLIRPLSGEERKQLRESLSICGLLTPLVVWQTEGKTILVDGHNRLSLWKKFDGFGDFEFKTQELRFGNRDKVKEWIIKNQLGRRNLSPGDFTLLVGQLYNQRKKSNGARGCKKLDQNEPASTAAAVAAETGVSPATVKRAGELAAKVEKIKQAEPELPRREVIAKAKKIVSEAKAPQEPPKRSLDELLESRWKSFIKDIAVTNHTTVRLWVTAKLKKAAL